MVFLFTALRLHGGAAALIFSFAYTVHKNFQKAIEAAKLNYTTDRRKGIKLPDSGISASVFQVKMEISDWKQSHSKRKL